MSAGDESLILEGCVRAHDALAPLFALPNTTPLCLKLALAVHACTGAVHNLVQDSFAGQDGTRLAAARALAALTLHALQKARALGEDGIVAELAALRAPLLAAYDPRMDVPGRKEPLDRCWPPSPRIR